MVERISAAEAKARLEAGWIFLDVRSELEFEQGHPEGAYNAPLMHLGSEGMTPNDRFVEVVAARFAKSQPIVVGCKSGARSLRAAELLSEAGFEQVVDQRAGFAGVRSPFGQLLEKGWAAEGLPVATEALAGRRWSELSRT
jgi:rhodanese-related sulfurtransferase